MQSSGKEIGVKGPDDIYVEKPLICAIYPTFAILCWKKPCGVPSAVSAIKSWSYTLQWKCDCVMGVSRCLNTVKDCAVLPLDHPGEHYRLRLICHAVTNRKVPVHTATDLHFEARCDVTVPWLHTDSLLSPFLFDALFLCENRSWATIGPSRCHFRMVEMGDPLPCCLESGFSAIQFRAVYSCPYPPCNTKTVYHYVLCKDSLPSGQVSLLNCNILRNLHTEAASAIFCGVGQQGTMAAMTAYELIVSDSSDARKRIFSIAFGAPTYLFLDDLPTISRDIVWSGNLLFYMDTGPDAVGLQVGDLGHSEEYVRYRVPLGVACGLVLDFQSGQHCLHTATYDIVPFAGVNQNTKWDVGMHLHRLANILFPLETKLLHPCLTEVTYYSGDAGPVILLLNGSLFQPHPCVVCVTARSGIPVCTTLIAHTPLCVKCSFSLIHLVAKEFMAQGNVMDQITVEISVRTDVGCTQPQSIDIAVPREVIKELLFAFSPPPLSHSRSWMTSSPKILLEKAVQLEHFFVATGGQLPATSPTGFFSHTTTALLSALASSAEAATFYCAGKGINSTLDFLKNIDTSAPAALHPSLRFTEVETPKLPPLKEASYMEAVLREYVTTHHSLRHQHEVRLQSWQTRLLAGLSWFNDNIYESVLRLMHAKLHLEKPPSYFTTIALEALLWQHVRHCLVSTTGGLIGGTTDITRLLRFESFYKCVGHLCPPSTATKMEEAAIFIIALWSVCLISELRQEYFYTHVIAVTGRSGSGCSTVANAFFCAERDLSLLYPHTNCAKRVSVRTVQEAFCDDLCVALQTGIDSTVVIVGEMNDVVGKDYVELRLSLEKSLTSPDRQHLLVLVTKLDEHMHRVAMATLQTGEDLVRAVRVAVEEEVMRRCGTEVLGVSLAPSVNALAASSVIQRLGIPVTLVVKFFVEMADAVVRKVLSEGYVLHENTEQRDV